MTRVPLVLSWVVLLFTALLGAPAATLGQGTINVYCSVQAEWCQGVANEFQRQTGIRAALTLKGSGETFAQVSAEAANPKGDVWFGGTGDPRPSRRKGRRAISTRRRPTSSLRASWARPTASRASCAVSTSEGDASPSAGSPVRWRIVAWPTAWSTSPSR